MGRSEATPAEMTFGTRIQQLRRDRRLTQRTVAEKLQIDFTYLSKLENDRGEPPGEETVRGLAKLYGVDVEELLALAGRIPAELRERAQGDVEFATLLRTLPKLSAQQLERVYRSAGVKRQGR
jgi:HTH-type transcriptional regulator, competence development regulator